MAHSERGLSRLEAKKHLESTLGDYYLKLLPFKAYLLVISTPHKKDKSPEVVTVNKTRLIGKPGEFYFIAVYYDLSYDYTQYHLIAHETVELLNIESKQMWRIPLHLCQDEDRICEPTPFSYYLDETLTLPEEFEFNVMEMQKAFDTRLKLYRWFSMGIAYQDSHPLRNFDQTATGDEAKWGSSYVGNSPNIKVFDILCYFFLAHFCPASSILSFIAAEQNLLGYKLLLRPSLGTRICEVMQTEEDTLLHALASLRDFHKKNITRIRAMDVSAWPHVNEIKPLALNLVKELARDAVYTERDEEAEEERKRVLLPSHAKLTPKSPLCLSDICKNAPLCMKRLIDKAITGGDEQRASMTPQQRNHLNRFLMEHKVDKEDILIAMRPKIMIAYEMEPGGVAWKDLKKGLKQSEAEAEMWKEEKDQPHLLCMDLMRIGLCAHMKPTPSNFEEMTLIQKKASGKARFIAAKQECHKLMQGKWAENSRKFVLRKTEMTSWTDSPWAHTHVALKGPSVQAANEKKSAEKRKTPEEEASQFDLEAHSEKKKRTDGSQFV